MEGLDDVMIATLIPSIGKRSKFTARLKNHKICISAGIDVAQHVTVLDYTVSSDGELKSANSNNDDNAVENISLADTVSVPENSPISEEKKCKLRSKLRFPCKLPALSPMLAGEHKKGTLATKSACFIREMGDFLLSITDGTPTASDYDAFALTAIQTYPFLKDESSVKSNVSYCFILRNRDSSLLICRPALEPYRPLHNHTQELLISPKVLN